MCGQLYLRNKKLLIPGQTTDILPCGEAIWGFVPPYASYTIYNARFEKLNTTWRTWIPGLLYVEAFFEKDTLFDYHGYMSVIWSELQSSVRFLVVTQPAKGAVARVHHRMPVVPDDSWVRSVGRTSGIPL